MTTESANTAQTETRPELFFGLVAPLGAPLDQVSAELDKILSSFGYTVIEIRMSSLLEKFPQWKVASSGGEAARIDHLQKVANAVRMAAEDPAILARATIGAIRAARQKRTDNPDCAAPSCAYIINQIKHPSEVTLLRNVYGPSFYLIAAHASKSVREIYLAKRLAHSVGAAGEEANYKSAAVALIQEDEKSADQIGQNVRDAYPMADAFVGLNSANVERVLPRFIDLIFGHPFHTPSPEEFAMYQASALALRSSDDNRQVGAVIVNINRSAWDVRNADILAMGLNEVPKGGGGYYWGTESPDARDQALVRYQDDDRAEHFKVGILTDLLAFLDKENWLSVKAGNGSASDRAKALLPKLAGTRLVQLGEFSRPVHAEMAALIDAARRGVGIDQRSMFVTTFPCHNCAKHIVASGLRKVVYLEPYPKSRAGQLFGEALVLESEDGSEVDGKVVFSAYSGIGPRLYRSLFAMSEGRARLSLREWEGKSRDLAPVHVPRHLWHAYVVAERSETEALAAMKYGA